MNTLEMILKCNENNLSVTFCGSESLQAVGKNVLIANDDYDVLTVEHSLRCVASYSLNTAYELAKEKGWIK